MWILILVMVLPNGAAITEEKVTAFPDEMTCLWASRDRAEAMRADISQKVHIPVADILPVSGCAPIAGQDT